MLLDHVGERDAAKRIESAVATTLARGVGLTRDLGGEGTTESVTAEIIRNLAG
jgi:isocitrate/isopropylmalate dehydrogenase